VQNDRHSVVHLGREFVWVSRDDGDGLQPVSVRFFPGVPYSAEGEWLSAAHCKGIGLFCCSVHRFPFVKAIGGDEAAAALKWGAPHRFSGEGFCHYIDRGKSLEIGKALSEVGHHPPAHQNQFPLSRFRGRSDNWLKRCRRDVIVSVAQKELRTVGKQQPQFAGFVAASP
jgi:hypothetical protein